MKPPRAPLSLISPALGKHPHSEAQVLGAVTWLLMQSAQHRGLPLRMLDKLVLPPLKTGQYILLNEQQTLPTTQEVLPEIPVAWLAWANLSAQAEAYYLSDHLGGLGPHEWSSGDRMWFIHWIAPFGHTRALLHTVLNLIPNFCARALYHRGIERGMRVITFHGRNITPQRARQWWRERPMLAAAQASPDAPQAPSPTTPTPSDSTGASS
ncbi:MAG: toxin-activating lysine-acyltransferase [Burkholderiales bacterium]|nr:toxin-activating lysine-acyltransferase [Burkholderiales bacterium]